MERWGEAVKQMSHQEEESAAGGGGGAEPVSLKRIPECVSLLCKCVSDRRVSACSVLKLYAIAPQTWEDVSLMFR